MGFVFILYILFQLLTYFRKNILQLFDASDSTGGEWLYGWMRNMDAPKSSTE